MDSSRCAPRTDAQSGCSDRRSWKSRRCRCHPPPPPWSRETAALERRARISAGWQMCQGRPSDVPLSLCCRRSRSSVLDPNAVMQRSSVPSFFHETRSGYEKSLVCLIRSLRTVTSLSIAAASVLSRRSVSIWFGPAFKICFIISNVLRDLGHTLRWEI